MLTLQPDLSLRRQNNAALSSSDQVQAFLAGTSGFALDLKNGGTLWQDVAATVPAAAISDPVRRIDTVLGPTAYNWQTSGDTFRPLRAADGLTFDGVDDRFVIESAGIGAILRNAPAAFFVARFRTTSLATAIGVFGVSQGVTSSVARAGITVLTDGAFQIRTIRLDTDAQQAPTSATGLITTGVDYTISGQIDYAGTGAIEAWLDGVSRISATLTGTPGNTSDTDALRDWFGAAVNGVTFWPGTLGRFILAPKLASAAERAACETWVAG